VLLAIWVFVKKGYWFGDVAVLLQEGRRENGDAGRENGEEKRKDSVLLLWGREKKSGKDLYTFEEEEGRRWWRVKIIRCWWFTIKYNGYAIQQLKSNQKF